MENEHQEEKVILMAVAFDHVKNTYFVDLARGSNVAETAFAMTIVIKCLMKDGIISKSSEITDLITKYLTDPQYEELEGENN
jgi:hypothetical protein